MPTPLNLPLQESPRKHQAAKAQEETQVSEGKSLPPETLNPCQSMSVCKKMGLLFGYKGSFIDDKKHEFVQIHPVLRGREKHCYVFSGWNWNAKMNVSCTFRGPCGFVPMEMS